MTPRRDAYLRGLEELSHRDPSAELLWKIGRSDALLTHVSRLRAEVKKRMRGLVWHLESLMFFLKRGDAMETFLRREFRVKLNAGTIKHFRVRVSGLVPTAGGVRPAIIRAGATTEGIRLN